MSWLNLVSLFGCTGLVGLAWLIGGCTRPVPWRTVLGSAALIFLIGAVIFWFAPTRGALVLLNDVVVAALERSNEGAKFLFGPLALDPGETLADGSSSVGFVLAAQVLPAVIFFAALMAALYHLRVVQPLIRLFARLFHRTLGLSGAESLAGASNIFFGVESATTVRPYLEKMTRSELNTMLTCGMSTVASTTMAVYVVFLKGGFPQIAGHLISASVISIPAAAMVSKLIVPETGRPETLGRVPPLERGERHGNLMSALTAGSWDGLRLAAGIATLLIAVLGAVGLLDLGLEKIGAFVVDEPLSLGRLLGWLFTPVAWLLGIEAAELATAGRMLGERLLLTEIPVYQELGRLGAAGEISPRTLLILSYALCGFTHVASMGIFVGGAVALAPSRRDDLTGVALRALSGAVLATLITGAVAGAFYFGQTGLLGL